VLARSEALQREVERIAQRPQRQGVDHYGHPVSQEFKLAAYAQYERLRASYYRGQDRGVGRPGAVFAAGSIDGPSPMVRRLFGLDEAG
jgi:hypothetical protein